MNSFSWQRAVVKVGSALIAPDGRECSGRYLLALARFITASREQGKEIILVSSGSVAAGRNKVSSGANGVVLRNTPSIAEKQAMAAIGQNIMMANWQRFFDFPCAQVLLTADDLRDRTRYVNIKNTLREIINHHALPIVNENDTVAVNELKVGDNDNLGAYTALVAQADTLIICSDIDGLYTSDPRKNKDATLIPVVESIDSTIYGLAGGAGTSVGTGGMRTKIEAADKCINSGIQTLIVNGRHGETFDALLAGKVPGTLFKAMRTPSNARRLWLTHTLKTAGRIIIDKGAKVALIEQGASLLPSGIAGIEGNFAQGEAVEIVCENQAVAKGLSLYNAKDLILIKGKKSKDIASVLGYETTNVAVHRDDMVLL
ncbi:MAG: glutamate 5-kinase [Pseudomonadota bacterium]|jgi:glutamate 5-kinase|uniref:glutamate 5-kinase n=1 Tax=Alteromonas sp. TaxID=232 RepID=UPI000B75F088|nr:glutamate 5-kinase [Alteromonas sp.]MAI36411.1 glutamate 5-kinase [Alteromonas sp.]MDY6884738.1 glutamate 5-kinase [Pseudomonadota bacterium]OUX91233.1 MAG: glutamate 5-kinase [Alteromonas sp. TMED35]|tara:strand:+ start:13838 stop:14956 length:1119 start_codon:yes stop_codon:yes gene_type:complete